MPFFQFHLHFTDLCSLVLPQHCTLTSTSSWPALLARVSCCAARVQTSSHQDQCGPGPGDWTAWRSHQMTSRTRPHSSPAHSAAPCLSLTDCPTPSSSPTRVHSTLPCPRGSSVSPDHDHILIRERWNNQSAATKSTLYILYINQRKLEPICYINKINIYIFIKYII